jgi:ribosome-associated protein
MTDFQLDGRPFITLDNLLKVEGLVESGGRAKQVIAEGMVCVDGIVETRKRKKISTGQKVMFAGETIQVL